MRLKRDTLPNPVVSHKILSAGILLCVESVFVVTFWKAGNALTGLCCALAAIGWLAWWIEYSAPSAAASSPPGKAAATPAAASAEDETAAAMACEAAPLILTPHFDSAHAAADTEADGAGKARAEEEDAQSAAGALSLADYQTETPAQLAAQVNAALADSEQGIATAIEAFLALAGAAQQITECAGEIALWREEANPLLKTAVAHMLGCSQAVSRNIDGAVTALQFQDLLRQRLEHVAAALDSMPVLPERQTGAQRVPGRQGAGGA